MLVVLVQPDELLLDRFWLITSLDAETVPAAELATLDRTLARLHANKAELLVALDRPDIPLHTNGSENGIRCQVTKRAQDLRRHPQRSRTQLPRRLSA